MSKDSEEPSSDSSPTAPDERTVRYELTAETDPSVAVVEAVAAATNRDPREMPPLHTVVDTDALDALATAETVQLSFEYLEASVTIRRDGVIELTI